MPVAAMPCPAPYLSDNAPAAKSSQTRLIALPFFPVEVGTVRFGVPINDDRHVPPELVELTLAPAGAQRTRLTPVLVTSSENTTPRRIASRLVPCEIRDCNWTEDASDMPGWPSLRSMRLRSFSGNLGAMQLNCPFLLVHERNSITNDAPQRAI
jgi:hypothetical protein